MKYTRDQFLRFIKAIEETSYKPNDWEDKFLNDIRGKFVLTEKQSEVLGKIYEKSTGGGQYQNRQYFGRG